MSDIRQFKLSSGDEIVCDVVGWPESDDDPAIVVRNVYQVVAKVTDEGRFYQFSPWMVYQGGNNVFQSINVDHIIADANPSTMILEYYNNVTEEYADEEEATTEVEYSQDSDSGNLVKFPGSKTIH